MEAGHPPLVRLRLFVDSSAFYAHADEADADHPRAVQVLGGAESLVTTDHVLVETWLLIRSRASRREADLVWAGLREGAVAIEPVGLADLEVAYRIGEEFADQDFSIVDRTCFAVMERLGLTRVASFDDDFAIYRFGPRRERAFEVMR